VTGQLVFGAPVAAQARGCVQSMRGRTTLRRALNFALASCTASPSPRAHSSSSSGWALGAPCFVLPIVVPPSTRDTAGAGVCAAPGFPWDGAGYSGQALQLSGQVRLGSAQRHVWVAVGSISTSTEPCPGRGGHLPLSPSKTFPPKKTGPVRLPCTKCPGCGSPSRAL
jgi:hypothetical protein